MKTRILTCIAFVLLSFSTANAQWTYDFLIGATKNKIVTDGNGPERPATTNWGYGYRLGFIGRYATKFNLSVGSGIIIGEKRNEKIFGLASTGYYYNSEIQHSEYFQMPLLVGYNIKIGDCLIRPEVGGYANYNFGGRLMLYGYNNGKDFNKGDDWKINPFKDAGSDYYRSYNRFDVGVTAGATIEYMGVGINVSYYHGLHKMGGDYENVKTRLWAGSLIFSI
jgi:hypothetical protein